MRNCAAASALPSPRPPSLLPLQVHSAMIKTTSAVATTVLGEAKILLLLALSALLLGEPAVGLHARLLVPWLRSCLAENRLDAQGALHVLHDRFRLRRIERPCMLRPPPHPGRRGAGCHADVPGGVRPGAVWLHALQPLPDFPAAQQGAACSCCRAGGWGSRRRPPAPSTAGPESPRWPAAAARSHSAHTMTSPPHTCTELLISSLSLH